MQLFDKNPIIAIATATGHAGIGVVRISGTNLSDFAHQLLRQHSLKARHAHYLSFLDADDHLIDEGIALFFQQPHSFTGEDVLELQGHGGPAVLKQLLQSCLAQGQSIGLRMAKPGEFTQRAFLNGRLDLAQAEAVADLIDANSAAAARGAIASLSGEFSTLINQLAEQIIHLRMLVEATLDFPEEEIEFLEKYHAAKTLAEIHQQLEHVLRTSEQGLILREGMHIVLVGQPNVGKSSLLNALAGDDVAIVTPIAGTTRDRVIQQIHLDGIPLHIVDTAGLRDTDDEVERIGIERTWAEIQKADVILHLHDVTLSNETTTQDILNRLPTKTPLINVYNKIDLLGDQPHLTTNHSFTADTNAQANIFISVREKIGLDDLRTTLLTIIGWHAQQETPWLARERHVTALRKTAEHLSTAAEHAAQDDHVLDLFAEELRLAHEALKSITGEFTSDDLLGEIFSSFCIGK